MCPLSTPRVSAAGWLVPGFSLFASHKLLVRLFVLLLFARFIRILLSSLVKKVKFSLFGHGGGLKISL